MPHGPEPAGAAGQPPCCRGGGLATLGRQRAPRDVVRICDESWNWLELVGGGLEPIVFYSYWNMT